MQSAASMRNLLIGLLVIGVGSAIAAGTGSGATGSSAAGVPPSNSAARFDVNVEFKLGQEALLKQKYAIASRAFGRVLQVIPRDANTNLLAGMAKAGLGKTKDARRHFEKAAKYAPNLILAHQELALVQIKLGKIRDAEEVLAELRARADKCADACAQAADLKSAIPIVEAALKAPETSQVPAAANDFLLADSAEGDRAYLAAVALINERRYDEALDALAQSARVFGPHPDILTYVGFTHRKLGRFDVAERYYRQALAAAPEHRGALEYYGELMVERGDMTGAQRMLTKLDVACDFGCAEADELRRWIANGRADAS